MARDRAFCFLYEDNLDLLRAEGAEIVEFSPLDDRELPKGTELLYLGGGYPEIHAEAIAENAEMRRSIGLYHRDGGRIYAECGGMMACGRSLRDAQGREFPMWDLIPARTILRSRYAALGYVTARSTRDGLLGPEGTEVRGHEFHYSTLEPLAPLDYGTELIQAGSRAETGRRFASGDCSPDMRICTSDRIRVRQRICSTRCALRETRLSAWLAARIRRSSPRLSVGQGVPARPRHDEAFL